MHFLHFGTPICLLDELLLHEALQVVDLQDFGQEFLHDVLPLPFLALRHQLASLVEDLLDLPTDAVDGVALVEQRQLGNQALLPLHQTVLLEFGLEWMTLLVGVKVATCAQIVVGRYLAAAHFLLFRLWLGSLLNAIVDQDFSLEDVVDHAFAAVPRDLLIVVLSEVLFLHQQLLKLLSFSIHQFVPVVLGRSQLDVDVIVVL
jgi:hypothetical protein